MDSKAPKSRISTAQRIERALLDDISAGQIAPGERLDETRLAERFGASRTPVREALGRLCAQGVLEEGNARGTRVAQYSKTELAQMFEAMHEIEALCARLAAQRLTLLARTQMEAAQEACRVAAAAGDLPEYLRANEAFHFAIYEATGNPYIQQLASDFRRRTGPFRAKKFATKADLTASSQSHDDLLQKIFSEDSDLAFEGMRKHMEASFMRVLALS
ncbi:GntR family transcriptional regulator [Rhodophyticola sp. CCM32]|uniref:GntR family transcriptional regulator n=1 Tax=Rhodophyticola sp. CCM32 TaxID=2916397 RepID=UPI00107F9B42|nr:GntR family transcriptional regulator [Rhodophyticola sp. CCM32]QBY00486.1 GntR family transcriptional regulator [Rhodophyticola sp. CCM32]